MTDNIATESTLHAPKQSSSVRMAVPSGATLHHSCGFTLHHRHGDYLRWSPIARSVRTWASLRIPEENTIAGAWFFTGGEWRSRSSRVVVRTARLVGSGTDASPEFWALQFDRPCTDFNFRDWRTEIGLTRIGPDSIFVSSRTYHWLHPNYLGPEPQAPVPTAPKVVDALMSMRQVVALSGTEELTARPTVIRVGHGSDLIESLRNKGRLCPVVYVSAAGQDQRYRLDPTELATVLGGAAKVFFAADDRLDQELSYLLPDDFRCHAGAVRVYQPGLDFDTDGDWRRHRFFSRSRIDELGEESVRDILVRSICRRHVALPTSAVASIDDVVSRDREYALRDLRERKAELPEKEFVDLILETNAELETDCRSLREECERIRSTNAKLQDDLDEARSERDSRIGAAKFLQSQVDEARATIAALERQASAIEKLSALPGNLTEVMCTIAELRAHRMVITDTAMKSVADATYEDLGEAWRCLWTVPTVLWHLIFEEGRTDWAEEYTNRTGYALAMTETKATKSDKSIMKSRRILFDGQDIDITPHIKIGSREPKCLRVHFWVDRDRRRIVVGHFGNHMDTAGTRRL